jgi:ornithine cyclodeaminase
MRLVALPEILAAIDEDAITAAIEDGFRRYSAGEAQVMAVGHLAFADPPGDCHSKGAYLLGDDVFAMKLATSFYRNPERGLPSGNGFSVIVSAKTGEILAILQDEGYLTDLRTALAGAIAARLIARKDTQVLGVVGSGMQARLQARAISRVLGIEKMLVWARDPARAAAVGGEVVSLEELAARADLIVTTTPSTVPLITAQMARPGMRIVGVGADSPGKSEIDPLLLARARIVVDSRAQCVDHGDTSNAIGAGLIDGEGLVELGELIAAPIAFAEDDIVVADLTGVAIQDVQIAKAVWARLGHDSMVTVGSP